MALPEYISANILAIQIAKLNELDYARLYNKYPNFKNLSYTDLLKLDKLLEDELSKKASFSITSDIRTGEQRVKAAKAAQEKLKEAEIIKNMESGDNFQSHITDYIPLFNSLLRGGESLQWKMLGDNERARLVGTLAAISSVLDLATLPFGRVSTKALLGSWVGGETGKAIGQKYDSPYLGLFLGSMVGGSISGTIQKHNPSFNDKGILNNYTRKLINQVDTKVQNLIPVNQRKYYRRFLKNIRLLDNYLYEKKHPDLVNNAILEGRYTPNMTFSQKREYLRQIHDKMPELIDFINNVSFHNFRISKEISSPSIPFNTKNVRFTLRKGIFSKGNYDDINKKITVKLGTSNSGRILRNPLNVVSTTAHELGHWYSRNIPRNRDLVVLLDWKWIVDKNNPNTKIFEPIYSKHKPGSWHANPEEMIATSILLKYKYGFLDFNSLDLNTKSKVAEEFAKRFNVDTSSANSVLSNMSINGFRQGGKLQ